MKSDDLEVGKVYRFIPGMVNKDREADRFKFAGLGPHDKAPVFWQVAGLPVYFKFSVNDIGPEFEGTVGFVDVHEYMEPCEDEVV